MNDAGAMYPPDADAAPRRTMQRWESIGSARFLTFSCYQRLPLLNDDASRQTFVDALRSARDRHRFRLIAWVLMPEHVHLLIVPRPVVGTRDGRSMVASASDVRTILWGLKKPMSQRVLSRRRAVNDPIVERLRQPDGSCRFWQAGGGFDRNVRDQEEFLREIRYIHDNPVRRGLCGDPLEWPWSSARWYSGHREGQVPIDFDLLAKWTPPEQWVREAVMIDEVLGKGKR